MLFIFTSYTANIVTLLQSTSTSINSLDGLLHSSMVFGVEDTPYHRHWFPAQTETTRKAIYREKIVPPNHLEGFTNLTHGVSMLRQGLFAFHMELSRDDIIRCVQVLFSNMFLLLHVSLGISFNIEIKIKLISDCRITKRRRHATVYFFNENFQSNQE